MASITDKPNLLNIIIWTVQTVLALVFLLVGSAKIFMPIQELSSQMFFVTDVPKMLTRFIGIAEVLGGLGLILPSIFQVKPFLTPLAALGLLTIMILAIGFHIYRGEYIMIGFNMLIGAIAIYVAWARYKKLPLKPK